MTSRGDDGADEPVDLTKSAAPAPADASPGDGAGDTQLDFDPYRFGLPEHPVPPEFAPPGYRPPQPPAAEPFSPYGPSSPYGTGPGSAPGQGSPPGYGPPPGFGTPPYAGGAPTPTGYPGQHGPTGYPGYPGYPTPGAPGQPGMPGSQGYGAPPQDRPNHGKAIASMVCGIVSIVLCWTSYLDALLVLPALILGIIVLSDRRSSSRGMALTGVICSVVGAILAVVLTVFYVHLVNQCGDLSGSQQQQCIRDKI